MKHKIYFTIFATLMMGLVIGSLFSTKGFEPRAEFEVFGFYDKSKTLFAIIMFASIFYIAGTEYIDLKKWIIKD